MSKITSLCPIGFTSPDGYDKTGFTRSQQIGLLGYCPWATIVLYSSHNKSERRRNDGGRTSPVLTVPGMELSPKEEKRERVFLRQKMETWRCLHLSGCKSRRAHKRASLRETSKSLITNKATVGWHIIKFIAVRLSLPQPGKLARDNPYLTLPTLTIRVLPNKVKILCKCGRTESRCAHE